MSATRAGLCERCGHARRIVTRTGSRFLLCELSRSDRRFPRYPRLPVLACAGYEPAKASGAPMTRKARPRRPTNPTRSPAAEPDEAINQESP